MNSETGTNYSPDHLTHEELIKNVAQQMGSAHEDDGLSTELAKLVSLDNIGFPSYARRLRQYADFALQIGERVLDHAEGSIGYKRQARRECGNVSFALRCRPNEDVIVPVPLASMESKISETEISVLISRESVAIETRKHGVSGPRMEIAHRADPATREDVLVAFMYSSQLREARVVIIPGDTLPPTAFDIGWLDANEITTTSSLDMCEPFLTLRWINRYGRLLSTSDCEMLSKLSPDAREICFENSDEDVFPA